MHLSRTRSVCRVSMIFQILLKPPISIKSGSFSYLIKLNRALHSINRVPHCDVLIGQMRLWRDQLFGPRLAAKPTAIQTYTHCIFVDNTFTQLEELTNSTHRSLRPTLQQHDFSHFFRCCTSSVLIPRNSPRLCSYHHLWGIATSCLPPEAV